MSATLGLTENAVKSKFYQKLPDVMSVAWWNGLVAVNFDSDQESEVYRMIGMPPMPREWTSERAKKGLRVFDIPIANKDWESTLAFPLRVWNGDKTGQVKQRVAELPIRFRSHINKLLSTLIINGTGSTNGRAYDGQFYFDTDHVSGDSGTQTNVLTNTQVPRLAVVSSTNPTESEIARAILGVISYAQSIKDDQGELINEDALEWVVMVPQELGGVANAAVYNATVRGASAIPDANPLQSARAPNDGTLHIRLVVNARLTTATNFKVFRADGSTKPFILQMHSQPEVAFIGPGTEHAIKFNEVLVAAKATYNAGYGQWEHAYDCTLSNI